MLLSRTDHPNTKTSVCVSWSSCVKIPLMIQLNDVWPRRRRDENCWGWYSYVVGISFASQIILTIIQLLLCTSDLLLIVGCESWCKSESANAGNIDHIILVLATDWEWESINLLRVCSDTDIPYHVILNYCTLVYQVWRYGRWGYINFCCSEYDFGLDQYSETRP